MALIILIYFFLPLLLRVSINDAETTDFNTVLKYFTASASRLFDTRYLLRHFSSHTSDMMMAYLEHQFLEISSPTLYTPPPPRHHP